MTRLPVRGSRGNSHFNSKLFFPRRLTCPAIYLCAEAKGADPELGTQLLHDALKVTDADGIDGKIHSADLVRGLIALEGRPWEECNRGRAITQNWVSKELTNYGIKSKNVRLGTVKRGYERTPLSEAVRRYCETAHEQEIDNTSPAPPAQNATPLQTNVINDLEAKQNATQQTNVAFQNNPNPLKNNDCSGVAFQRGLPEEKTEPEPASDPQNSSENDNSDCWSVEI